MVGRQDESFSSDLLMISVYSDFLILSFYFILICQILAHIMLNKYQNRQRVFSKFKRKKEARYLGNKIF